MRKGNKDRLADMLWETGMRLDKIADCAMVQMLNRSDLGFGATSV